MSFMSEMNFWPGFPLNQTPETMRVFFSFYKTRVLLEFIHPLFPILTYPQLERKTFEYPYMDLHLEARLLSFSTVVDYGPELQKDFLLAVHFVATEAPGCSLSSIFS